MPITTMVIIRAGITHGTVIGFGIIITTHIAVTILMEAITVDIMAV